MSIDDEIPATYYAVFDGHGGPECADYLAENLHLEIRKCFMDEIDGIKDTEDVNETLYNCITRAFQETDNKYR